MTGATQLVDDNGKPIQALRINSTQAVDGTSATTQSTAFTTVGIIRVVSNVDINIAQGSSPSATTSTCFIPAGSIEYFRVNENDKIAVLGGIGNITLME